MELFDNIDEEELQSIFSLFDTDNNGRITYIFENTKY